MRRMHGVDYPDDLMFPNKKAIRIKVKLPSSDRRLFHWPAWSRKRMSRQWLDALHKAGGPRWSTWYLYFGVVPHSDFQIGKASCRERVCQYVYISVAAVQFKKTLIKSSSYHNA